MSREEAVELTLGRHERDSLRRQFINFHTKSNPRDEVMTRCWFKYGSFYISICYVSILISSGYSREISKLVGYYLWQSNGHRTQQKVT